MKRFENWPELLAAFLEQHKATPFEWGRFDCALFAADAIHIMTGVDLAEDFRLQYDSALGATRQMQKFLKHFYVQPSILMDEDTERLLEKVAAPICFEHGMQEIPVALAARGDLVFLAVEETHALGIVGLDGMTARFVGGPDVPGLLAIPLSACKRAWRVGE